MITNQWSPRIDSVDHMNDTGSGYSSNVPIRISNHSLVVDEFSVTVPPAPIHSITSSTQHHQRSHHVYSSTSICFFSQYVYSSPLERVLAQIRSHLQINQELK